MSKIGNIRGGKTQKKPAKKPTKRPLNKKDAFLPRAEYSADGTKSYMLAAILIFHVLPLVLMLCGDMGRSLLNSSMRAYVNPMAVLAILLVYGIKAGFNFKLPVFVTLLSAVSTIMYYNIGVDESMGLFYYYFLNIAAYLCIYAVMAFIGIFAGALINKLGIFGFGADK